MNKKISEQGKQKMGYKENYFFIPIFTKLVEVVVVQMDTTTSPSFNKIGLNTKNFLFVPV